MDRPAEHTVFSLSDQMPEPKAFADHAVPEISGKTDETILARGAVGELCSVRKLSRRGAVLHLDSPVAVGQHLSFELANGRSIVGIVSWVRGSEVILRFAADLDVLGVIAAELVSQPGERRRMPRIEMGGAVVLHIGPRIVNGGLVDLSQGGVKIAVREALPVDTPLNVALPGFRTLPAEVRWCEGGQAGLIFEVELGWQEMMPWLRAQSASARSLAPRLPADTLRDDVISADPISEAGKRVGDASPSVELNIPARIREGAMRWDVAVLAITTTHVEFTSYTRPRFGTLISVSLPGLPVWPGRVTLVEGDRWTCEFSQPLHPAVLQRMTGGCA